MSKVQELERQLQQAKYDEMLENIGKTLSGQVISDHKKIIRIIMPAPPGSYEPICKHGMAFEVLSVGCILNNGGPHDNPPRINEAPEGLNFLLGKTESYLDELAEQRGWKLEKRPFIYKWSYTQWD